LIALRLLGVFDMTRFNGLRLERRRNSELRATVNQLATKLQNVARIDDVFESIHQLAPAVAATAVRARIGAISFEHPHVAFSDRPFEAKFFLGEGSRVVGDVVLMWGDGRERLEEDHALAIEEVCESVARAVLRVSPHASNDSFAAPVVEMAPATRRSEAG
jgi:hypothetical protein